MNSDINRPDVATNARNSAMSPGESLEPLGNAAKVAEVTETPLTARVMKAMVYRSHRGSLMAAAVVALLVLGCGVYAIHRADVKANQARLAQQSVAGKLTDPAKEVLTINSQLKVLHQAEINTLTVDSEAGVTGGLTVNGAATIGKGLTVTGNGNFTGNITAANFNTSSLQVNGSGNFSGSLNVNNVTATSISINGNGNFSGNLNIAGNVQGNVLDGNTFAVNGVAGVSVVCTGGQVLANADIQSGIVVGGNCVTVAAGGGGSSADLQTAYNNSTTPEITLNSTNGALTLRDTLAGLGGNLLEVQNNAGSTTYFAVSSAGVNATAFSGNGSALSNVDAVSLQGNAASYFTNAGNISTGTLADGRLSTNVALLASAANFTSTLQHNGNDVCDASGNCSTAGAAGGDLTGSYPNPTIAKLQGGTLTIGTLASGNYLRYNGSAWVNSGLQAGDVPSGSSSYIQNGTTVQAAANFYIRSAAIGSVGAVVEGANGQTADLLDLNTYNGTSSTTVAKVDNTGNLTARTITQSNTLGTSLLYNTTVQVGSSGTTALLVQGTVAQTAPQMIIRQSAAGTSDLLQFMSAGSIVAAKFSTNGNQLTLGTIAASGTVFQGKVVLADGTTDNFGLTLQSTTLTAGRTITLPDENGTLCVQGSASCGFAVSSGSGSYIQNGTVAQTGASFFIQPTSGNIGGIIKANGVNYLLQLQNSTGTPVVQFDPSGLITTSGQLVASGTGISQVLLNSSGPNYGTIQNDSANTWSLGYKNSSGTSLGTAVISWNANNTIALNGNVTLASQDTITMAGGLTSQRPASPTDGMLYFDTTTHQLLQYSSSLSKWVSDRSTANKIVAMGTATGCTGTSPVASSNPDGADYIVTSCTSAQTTINAAFAALPASGGTVYLEDGTYVVDGSVSIPSNVSLEGSGASTELIFKDSIVAPAFNLIQNSNTTTGNSRISVRNLRIDGNSANETIVMNSINMTKVGSTASNTPGFTISNVWVENSLADALVTTLCAHGSITNSIFSGNGQGGYSTMYLAGGGYISVTGNSIQNSRSQGILASGTNLTISGNSIRNAGRAVYLNGATDSSITGNSIAGNSVAGMVVVSASGNTISGNSINNNSGYGIQFVSSNQNSVNGNSFDNNNGDNVFIQNSSKNSVGNNTFINNSVGAYFLNVFDSASQANILSDNVFNGSAAHFINDAGTGTIYSNQQDGNGNLVVKSQGGGIAVGAGSANATLSLQGGLTIQTLPAPAAPTVTTVGTAGTTTWGYKITALDGVGETVGSTETQITTGNATLNATNYNKISWVPVGGAYQYKVYRTTAGGTPNTPGVIATVSGNTTTFNDQGVAGNLALPFGSNTTGGATVAGSLSVANGTVTISSQMIRMTGQGNIFGPSNNYMIMGSGTSNRILTIDNAAFPGTQIITNNTGQIVSAIRGASGQTADLLDLQNSSSNPMTKFNANGDLIIGGTNSAASANAFQVQDTSGVAFLTANSSTLTLTVKNVVITASLTVNGHIISGNSSGSTTITAGAAAICTTGSPSVSVTGDDTAGVVTITSATGVCSSGILATLNFANAYNASPVVVLSAGGASAASLQFFWGSATTTGFTVNTATVPTTATTYTFSYHVIQ